MLKLNKLLIILIFLCIFISLLCSINALSNNNLKITTNIQNIELYNKPRFLEINIYNSSDSYQECLLETNFGKFNIEPVSSYFYLKPREYKKVYLTINAIDNSVKTIYDVSLILKNNKDVYNIPLTITQHTNIVCSLDISEKLSYNKINNEYDLNLTFYNKSNNFINLKLLEILNIKNIDEEINILENKEESYFLSFDTNEDFVLLKYSCNGMVSYRKIDLQGNNNKLTGFFSFMSISSVLDSVILQIILIVILIFLVLSFTTNYIKFVYKK